MDTVVLEGGPAWLFLFTRLIEIALVILFTALWCGGIERALRACDATNRQMTLGQSYLVFIPLFGFVWQFIMVNKVSNSLAMEYHHRDWKSDEGRPAIETGLTACVVMLVVFAIRVLIIDFHPALAFLSSLAICLCMYLHRERLNAFTERLESENQKSMQSFFTQSGPNPFMQQQYEWQGNQQWQNAPQFAPNPYGQPQYVNAPLPPPVYAPHYTPTTPQSRHQQMQDQVKQKLHEEKLKREKEESRPGWDGTTTWLPPHNWSHPDLTDAGAYFS